MPYNSTSGAYERRATTVIDATPDGDTVAVAIDVKLDQGIDDYVVDLNHHKTNGNHYPATSTHTDSRFLDQSPAGVVSWKDGVPAANAALKDFSNVASGAISPAKIAQDASNRFVTDTEKTTWNGALYDKADVEGVLTGENIASHGHSGEISPCLSSEEYFYARDEKTAGTNGGSASAATLHTRDINTVVENTISGASLASNKVTLPAGTYYVRATAPCYEVTGARLSVYDVTNAAFLGSGPSVYTGAASGVTSNCSCSCIFTLSAPADIELRQRTIGARATSGLGVAISTGVEIYSEVEIWKVG